jgi:hypothetical protein
MSPAIKYTFGRVGLFVVCFLILLPVPLNFLVRAMIALVVSAIASIFLLRRWRNEMAEVISTAAGRRAAEKDRLRAALAGDETAATEGDRAADTSPVVDGAAHETAAEPAAGQEKTFPGAGREIAEPAAGREKAEPGAGREKAEPAAGREKAEPAEERK